MKPAELLTLCQKQQDMGLSRIILTMPRPKSRRPNTFRKKVRTPFGYGEVANYHRKEDKLVFFIEIEKIRKYFIKTLRVSK